MRILFLEPQPCIRALKYAEGLKNNGHKIELYFGYCKKTLSELYGYGDEFFDGWFKLDKDKLSKQIKRIVKKNNIQIVHSHNAPDFLTVSLIKELKGKVPIIHDTHDLLSIRVTPYGDYNNKKEILKYEKIANKMSDGLICVSSGIKNILKEKYTPSNLIVFPNFVPKKLVPKKLRKKVSKGDKKIHIVYEGSLDSKNKGSHYDLKKIFRKIAKQGIHIHIYASKENEEYRKFASKYKYLHYHGHLNTSKLFKEITQYDFGWAGFNTEKNIAHTDTVLANKVMEYASCGLPVISFEHRTQERFIKKNNIGIILKNTNQLKKKLKDSNVEHIKGAVLRNRHNFILEKNISKVIDFYNSTLNNFYKN